MGRKAGGGDKTAGAGTKKAPPRGRGRGGLGLRFFEQGGEGVVGLGEGAHGGVDDAGADLADARFLVRHARVDDGDEVLSHDFADVDAGGGAAEVEGWNLVHAGFVVGDGVHGEGVGRALGTSAGAVNHWRPV